MTRLSVKNLALSFFLTTQISVAQSGCTDPLASNYNLSATTNDGSCVYNNTSISVIQSLILPATLNETSGLIEWNNELYTHNDNSDTNLYKISKIDGSILQNINIAGVTNTDWEEISQDQDYIYIGDFGNNVSGNRTNLKIYKIPKSTTANLFIEIINFTYANQTDFTSQSANTTNFDCEAFVVTATEILLFTKQWTDLQTTVYTLPKTAGTHIANPLITLNVSGLITGATLMENYKLIALSGYSSTLSPFVYLLYDYIETNFQHANKRKIGINLGFHQIEAITTANGLDYHLTNENFVYAPIINNPQKLHTLSLNTFLSGYINSFLSNQSYENIPQKVIVFPNPAQNTLFFMNNNTQETAYKIIDIFGKTVQERTTETQSINIEKLKNGMYFIQFISKNNQVVKFIKN